MNKRTSEPKSIFGVGDWIEFSMSPHTETEIRKRILSDPISVCYSYLCRYSHLSEEFIDELAILSTGMVPSDGDMSIVIDRYKNNERIDDNYYTKISSNGKEFKVNLGSKITDKLDWVYICQFQRLSEQFILAHADKVIWKSIYKYQRLSRDFRRDNAYRLKDEKTINMPYRRKGETLNNVI